jgi:FKBP-type peptidyl-prolyl cis-trans isomerase
MLLVAALLNFIKQQGISDFNSYLVSKGISDATNQKPLMTEEQINMSITNYLQKIKAEKSAGNKKIGKEFLDANSKKTGVITLPSGLAIYGGYRRNRPQTNTYRQSKMSLSWNPHRWNHF